MPFIEQLIREYGQGDMHLVCVAHGGMYEMMLPQVLRNVDRAFIQRQGGIDYAADITAELTAGGLVCTEWKGRQVEAPHP